MDETLKFPPSCPSVVFHKTQKLLLSDHTEKKYVLQSLLHLNYTNTNKTANWSIPLKAHDVRDRDSVSTFRWPRPRQFPSNRSNPVSLLRKNHISPDLPLGPGRGPTADGGVTLDLAILSLCWYNLYSYEESFTKTLNESLLQGGAI